MRALRGIDLRIAPGEFVAVMGPSGSGKSTCMNMLGCLDTPTCGSYRFLGVPVGSMSADQRALLRRNYLGFVFQGFNLLSRTTALENVELPLIYRHVPAEERHARARQALHEVGLAGREMHVPSQLSGGQQQRVAIARAIVTEPQVLFADEPTGNLDTATSVEIMKLLTALNEQRGITIAMVTHEPDIAAWTRRIVRFRDGCIESDEANAPVRGAALMFWNAIVLALREIRRNVLRSSLTILGIVIGVAAVITMVTIGEGATAQVQADIQKLGTNLLQVFRGQGFGGRRRRALVVAAVHARTTCARSRARSAACAPSRRARNTGAQAIYGNTNWSTQVTGTTDKFLDVRDWPLASGRNFSESEMRGGAAVCLLGDTVRQELFGDQDPLGASIRLQKLSCQVDRRADAEGHSRASARTRTTSSSCRCARCSGAWPATPTSNAILVSARDGVSTEKVQADIESLLRERRKLRAGADDDFNIRDLKEVTSAFTSSTRVMTALLGAVAAVSLIVGGVGIMNIMLVSVTERTREIGTRLAVGAMARDVLLQFLVEAVTLAAFGGLIGIALGLERRRRSRPAHSRCRSC